jgi:hypothetical protein
MKLIQEKPLKKEPKIQHKIISKFVDPASFSEKYFWPREMKIANTLCKKYNPAIDRRDIGKCSMLLEVASFLVTST